jgi:DNA-binding MurR/RpiR family transcriptional regulator
MAPLREPGRTVADTLRSRRAELTPAELRVAQALLRDYPAAGLQPVAALAAAADVSAPTVLRLIAKLGLGGYPQLQRTLRAELSTRAAGPLQAYPADLSADPQTTSAALARAVEESLTDQDPAELAAAVDLIADPARTVIMTGGRFSATLALHLGTHLAMLRPGVQVIGAAETDRATALLDVDAMTTLVVFDYRRYQRDTVAFGRVAAEAGAAVIVCTDPYLSPLSPVASVLLTSRVDGPSPFLTLVPAFALVETLVLGVVERGGAVSQQRIATYEKLRSQTVD